MFETAGNQTHGNRRQTRHAHRYDRQKQLADQAIKQKCRGHRIAQLKQRHHRQRQKRAVDQHHRDQSNQLGHQDLTSGQRHACQQIIILKVK